MSEESELGLPEGFFDPYRRFDAHILYLLDKNYHPLYKLQACHICKREIEENAENMHTSW